MSWLSWGYPDFAKLQFVGNGEDLVVFDDDVLPLIDVVLTEEVHQVGQEDPHLVLECHVPASLDNSADEPSWPTASPTLYRHRRIRQREP